MRAKYYLAAIAVASLATVGAQAQISGSIWENYSSTTVGAPPTSTPNVTFTANQVDFGDSGDGFTTPYTIGGWLSGDAAGGVPSGTPPTVVTVLTGAGALNDSQYAGSGNTYVQLTGSIYLAAGVNNFQVGHDDGLIVSVAGATVSASASAPGPTAYALTPFTITASSAGTYNYTLDYLEVDGPPGALEWAYPNGQPVGAPDSASTLSLMGLGLAGVGLLRRRLCA